MKLLLINLLFLSSFLTACAEDESATPSNAKNSSSNQVDDAHNPTNADIKILFIGNSLTYSNNLPEIVQNLAEDDNLSINSMDVSKPNYALEDHINDGEIQGLIEVQGFDFVIIQQGPSSQSDGRESLVIFGEQIKTMCENAESKLIYFMVWPSLQYYHTFDGVIANYRNGALVNDALLAPVGEFWKNHFDSTSDFSYYGPDSFHPSLKGSKKAAEIIWETIKENI